MARLNTIWEKFGENKEGLILFQLSIDTKFSDIEPWNIKYGVKYPTVFWTDNDNAGMKLGEVLITKTNNVWTGGSYFIIKPDKTFLTTVYDIDEFENKLDDFVGITEIEGYKYIKQNEQTVSSHKSCRVWYNRSTVSIEVATEGVYAIDIYSVSGRHFGNCFRGYLNKGVYSCPVGEWISQKGIMINRITTPFGVVTKRVLH